MSEKSVWERTVDQANANDKATANRFRNVVLAALDMPLPVLLAVWVARRRAVKAQGYEKLPDSDEMSCAILAYTVIDDNLSKGGKGWLFGRAKSWLFRRISTLVVLNKMGNIVGGAVGKPAKRDDVSD